MITELHKIFIDNYLQTYSIEGAAKAAGIEPKIALTAGIDLLANPEVQEAMKERANEFDKATSNLKLTKERLVSIMMFQYEKANKYNKTKEAVEILSKIAEAQGLELKDIKIDPVNLIINNLDEERI